jgi:hypothetical protein
MASQTVWLLLRREEPGSPVRVPLPGPGEGAGGGRVRCPRCGWEPGRDARWTCLCGFSWNTFDTAGLCPACLRAWESTQCPRCHAWSPHEEWYAAPEPRPGG